MAGTSPAMTKHGAFASQRQPDDISAHAEKIAHADFHATMPENAVGGGGVEVEVREGEAAEELLTGQRQAVVGADRERDFARVGALELRGLERFQVIAGPGQPLPQLVK